MKKVAYYHVYLTDDYGTWSSIVMEQLTLLQNSGLADELDLLNINLVSNPGSKTVAFHDLLKTFSVSNKVLLTNFDTPFVHDDDMLSNINSDNAVTENVTMRQIWNDCQNNDMQVLYFHTKGVTSVKNLLEKNNAYKYAVYYHWRQFLNWGVIEKWQTCVNNLYFNDVAGVNYKTEPSKHFSGGFWWANSNYIKRLPDPSTLDWWYNIKAKSNDNWLKTASDRFRDEQWLCSLDDVRIYNINTPKNVDAASNILPRSIYKDDIELMWHPV